MLIPMHELQDRHMVRPTGILHIGGHVGEEADAYDSAGVKNVVWVEPHPDAYPSLVQNVGGRPGHLTFQVAASDVDHQEVPLYKASNICSSSLLPMAKHLEKHPDVSPCGTVQVSTIRMDSLLWRHGLKPTDYQMANLDIQGAELLALRGMDSWLTTGRWIYTEVNTEELYKGCVLLPELEAFLLERRFRLSEIRLFSKSHGWGDALFSREQ